MKIRILFLLAFSLFLMAGCTNVNQGNRTIEKEFYNMEAFIHVNGKEYEITRGGFEWATKLRSGVTRVIKTDHASPYQMSSSIDTINLKPNQNVKVLIEGDPQIDLYLWTESGREKKYPLSQNQFVTPANKGEYIFEVFSKWKNGEASYTFVVEIQ
ncbi:hypothetical protein [Bacillus sp. FJAT-27445]|uniref:hypothetical protein n=1 Tax=Bacillus sp. FJAT-27445 TaxID=1679166 RepID=UPI0007442613|nr:hypothetical protein [Bacillus sp. FJAT-27445]